MIQYLTMLQHIQANGTGHDDRTGVGTQRVFGYQNRYDLSRGLPILTTKKLEFRWIAEELFWFLSGSTHAGVLHDSGITIWDDWADSAHTEKFGRKSGDLGPIYGHQWRNYGASVDVHGDGMGGQRNAGLETHCDAKLRYVCPGFNNDGYDQIKNVCDLLSSNPNSRRIIVSGWNPKEATGVALPPCHTLFQFSVSDGKLSCQLYQRSADSFLGVPYNITSYALLTMLLAYTHNLQVGEFIHTFGDLHIYENHQEQVEEQLHRHPRMLPKLTFKVPGGGGFDALMDMSCDDLELFGYEADKSIKAPVAV